MNENTPRDTIEAILMVASESVATSDLTEVLGVSTANIEQRMRVLTVKYLSEGQERPRGFGLYEVAGDWRTYSAWVYADVVERFVVGSSCARLSQTAPETLVVIAYCQPISKVRICCIRGVNVDGVVRVLLTQSLVEETGLTLSDTRLCGTAGEFLERVGLTNLSELVPSAPYPPDADALEGLEEELWGLAPTRRVECACKGCSLRLVSRPGARPNG